MKIEQGDHFSERENMKRRKPLNHQNKSNATTNTIYAIAGFITSLIIFYSLTGRSERPNVVLKSTHVKKTKPAVTKKQPVKTKTKSLPKPQPSNAQTVNRSSNKAQSKIDFITKWRNYYNFKSQNERAIRVSNTLMLAVLFFAYCGQEEGPKRFQITVPIMRTLAKYKDDDPTTEYQLIDAEKNAKKVAYTFSRNEPLILGLMMWTEYFDKAPLITQLEKWFKTGRKAMVNDSTGIFSDHYARWILKTRDKNPELVTQKTYETVGIKFHPNLAPKIKPKFESLYNQMFLLWCCFRVRSMDITLDYVKYDKSRKERRLRMKKHLARLEEYFKQSSNITDLKKYAEIDNKYMSLAEDAELLSYSLKMMIHMRRLFLPKCRLSVAFINQLEASEDHASTRLSYLN